MAGIDRLAEVMGRDNDMDAIERDNLCGDAADTIIKLRAWVKRLEDEKK